MGTYVMYGLDVLLESVYRNAFGDCYLLSLRTGFVHIGAYLYYISFVNM